MAVPLRHIPKRTAHLAGALVVILVVAFFGATRTEIGRDAVARQIEARFAQATGGSLRIGSLTGNLARTFTATDVSISDGSGLVLLKVDTVVIRPSWEDLLRRRFDTRRLEIHRPTIYAVRADSGGWRDLLSGDSRTGSGWSFGSARVVVVDGLLNAPDGTGRMVTRVDSINFDAHLDGGADGFQVDLLSGTARSLSPSLSLLAATGQVLMDSTGVLVNRARLQTGGSDVSLNGLWRPGDAAFSVDLSAGTISFDELATLVPDLPLRGSGSVEVAATGRVSDFVINSVRLTAGSSVVESSGTLQGWPDSARVDLTVSARPLLRSDVARHVRDWQLPRGMTMDSLAGQAFVQGTVLPSQRSAEGFVTLDVGGRGGRAAYEGRMEVLDARLTAIDGTISVEELDLAQVYVTSVGSTRLNGSAQVAVDGLGSRTAATLRGTVDGVIRNSRIGSTSLDLLRFDASRDPRGGTVGLRLVQDTGTSSALLSWLPDSLSTVRAVIQTAGMDAGPLLGRPELSTAITAQAEARVAAGPRWHGSLTAVTESVLVRAGERVGSPPPQSLTMNLTPGAEGSRLSMFGSHVHGELDLSHEPGSLASAAGFWKRVLAAAVLREFNNPYRPPTVGLGGDDVELTVHRQDLRSELAGARARLSGHLESPDVSALTAWLPSLPRTDGSIAVEVDLVGGADSLRLDVRASTPRLAVGDRTAFGLAVDLHLDGRATGRFEETARISVRALADSVRGKIAGLPDARLTFRFANRAGELLLQGSRGDRLGPVHVSAGTTLLPDRVRIRLDSVAVAARQLDWRARPGGLIDLFQDAVVIEDLLLSEPTSEQRIEIGGALSPVDGDQLAVRADALQLREITDFGGLGRVMGGVLTADLAVTGGLDSPTVQGTAHSPAFVLDDRLLGEVRIGAEMLPDRETLAIELDVSPSQVPAMIPEVSETIENRVSVRGTVRPPRDGAAGRWDLDVDLTRADLFFLKYVFNTSVDRFTGYATGSGRLSGPFRAPVADMALDVREGAFSLPRIGTSFTLDGEVIIDREAIHIRRARLEDQDGGFAEITGPLLFNDYQFFSFDLEGSLQDLLVMNRSEAGDLPFYGFIRGTGAATLTGPLTNATLRIPDGRTRADSELFIPLVDAIEEGDESFIIFADSTGQIPNLEELIRRPFFLARRASAERQFLAGLDMDLNIAAPRGSLIRLVIDPLLGDVINAESNGVVQIRRNQGEFEVFGQMEVSGGDYLFTAGEVFVRRFVIQPGGVISWVGDPINARLNIPAAYRTRASVSGLEDVNLGGSLIPLVVDLRITGQVLSPAVDLGLTIDRSNQNALGDYQALEARLNQPDRATEYATSVLLTNSFQLTTASLTADAGEQLAFNSVSQLVSSQLSRFVNAALPNVDFNFGLQGERAEDLDITYGVALRLLDERLIIRGEGVYQGSSTDNTRANTQGIQGEFVVEVRLSPAVSAQVFFRREGDIIQNADLTNTAGAGLTYQTEFASWRRALRRLFGKETDPTPTRSAGDAGR